MSRSSTTSYNFSTSAKTSGGAARPISSGGSSKIGGIGGSSRTGGIGGSSRIGGSGDLRDFLEKVVIKNIDMENDMKDAVLQTSQDAMKKYDLEKERASYIKKELDINFDTTWHVIVGKHFGSFVTHETKHFIYFYYGPMAFLIWKSS